MVTVKIVRIDNITGEVVTLYQRTLAAGETLHDELSPPTAQMMGEVGYTVKILFTPFRSCTCGSLPPLMHICGGVVNHSHQSSLD